ncbi:hypothetical protein, partial [Escherichia coli]|uniref:hypothetical protein n=1 Tax=Escherichia coli TaxID=562 RepID=UPI00197B05E3
WEGWAILLLQKQKKLIMVPSETMIWQPEFTDKTLSRKTGAVHQPPDDTSHHVLRWHATALPVFTRINRYQNAE